MPWRSRLVVACVLVLISPGTSSSALLQWENGQSFTRFGPGLPVVVDLGQFTVTNSCPNPSDNDNQRFQPVADVYVVPAGSIEPLEASVLRDVSNPDGIPNTVLGATGGLFVLETLGYTLGGFIGPGTYAVVYDECQDGRFDPGTDTLFDPAFVVDIPVQIPELDTGAILRTKAAAAAEAVSWARVGDKLELLLKAISFNREVRRNFSLPNLIQQRRYGAIAWAFRNDIVKRELGVDGERFAILSIRDKIERNLAIVADPPDPDFRTLTELQVTAAIVPRGPDAIDAAIATVSNELVVEAALLQGTLRSLERYLGAAQAEDAEWALAHLRALHNLASLTATQSEIAASAIEGLEQALAAEGGAINETSEFLVALRLRIEEEGFVDDEIRLLKNFGYVQSELVELRTDAVGSLPHIGVSIAELVSDLAELHELRTEFAASFRVLADAAADAAAQLELRLPSPPGRPRAVPGGPYQFSEGVVGQLDGSGSVDPDGNVRTYDWDLDGDGTFDDASGVRPTVAFPRQGHRLVGLRVGDNEGLRAVSYVAIAVSDRNRAPTIDGSVLPDLVRGVEIGSEVRFSAAANDLDGDSTSITWFLDGQEAGAGNDFEYAPLSGSYGLHFVSAVASDGIVEGGSSAVDWVLPVVARDEDGDGWTATNDCDESSVLVHPGQREVPGNGIDDDCNDQTPDVRCGDGVIGPGEQCDAPDLIGATCESLGHGSGPLRCDQSSCTFDISLCSLQSVCGDGSIGRGESCDGPDLAGASCSALGLGTGTLQCTEECRLDRSECSVIQDKDGDGFPAEIDCDDEDPLAHPGSLEELGNGIDDDCNGLTRDDTSCNADDPSLVLCLDFEGNFDDGSGNANDAQPILHGGSVSADASGIRGAALRIDGVAWLEVPDSPSLDLSEGMTLSAWLNSTGRIGNNAGIFFKGPLVSRQPRYQITVNNSVNSGDCADACSSINGTGFNTSEAFANAPPIPEDAWTHLALTYNGDTVTLYQNGRVVASESFSGTIDVDESSLKLGNRFDSFPGDAGIFQGLMDDLRIYREALSESELGRLVAGSGSPTAVPVMHLEFEGSFVDSSPFANDAFAVELGGSARTVPAGIEGQALEIQGPAWLEVPNSPSLGVSEGLTLAAWVKPTRPIGNNAGIFFKGELDQTQARYQLTVGNTTFSGGCRRFCGGLNGQGFSTSQLYVEAPQFPLERWTHVATTYDGAVLRLYRDGREVARDEFVGTIQQDDAALVIGQRFLFPGDQGVFQGRIDEVRVHSGALSGAEIVDLATPPLCGDGVIDARTEACDQVDLGNTTCAALGLGSGVLACTPECTFSIEDCTGYVAIPRCGDGIVNQSSEACDGSDLSGYTCEELGRGPGELRCSPTCELDLESCPGVGGSCGDGLAGSSESCDGQDLRGLTCGSLGLGGDGLTCGEDCRLNASRCVAATPFCGDGIINQPAEACDGQSLADQTCRELGFGGGQLGCTAQCSFSTEQCIAAPVPCDVTGDGQIDHVDIQRIFERRGTSASSELDLMDVDGDGLVTVNDGRECVLRCSNPDCASVAPSPSQVNSEPIPLAPLARAVLAIVLGVASLAYRQRRWRTH